MSRMVVANTDFKAFWKMSSPQPLNASFIPRGSFGQSLLRCTLTLPVLHPSEALQFSLPSPRFLELSVDIKLGDAYQGKLLQDHELEPLPRLQAISLRARMPYSLGYGLIKKIRSPTNGACHPLSTKSSR